jgi:hypothetical protein
VRHEACGDAFRFHRERAVPDDKQISKNDPQPAGDQSTGTGGQPSKDDNEWLRDQVGEDHNLSGSSTYRNLPDQPSDNQDAEDRQSNR